MMHHPLRSGYLIIALTLAMTAGTLSAEPHVPVKPLRDSARKILADPEFRHFDHFADDDFRKADGATEAAGTDTPAGKESREPGATSSSDGESPSSSEAEPWWKNVLNKSQPKEATKDQGSSRNQRLSPSPSSETTEGEHGSERQSSGGEGTSRNGASSTSPRSDGARSDRTTNRSEGSDSSGNNSRTATQRGDNSSTEKTTTGNADGEPAGDKAGGLPSSGTARNRASSAPTREPTGDAQPSSKTGTDPSNETSSGNAAEAESATGTPGSPSRKTTRPSNSPTRPESTTRSPSSERPVRMQQPRSPSQRGADGVQRPVRQSSRTAPQPKPSSPDSSRWEGPSLGLGSLFGGLFHGVAYLILAVIVVAIIVLILQAVTQAWNDRQLTTRGGAEITIGPLTHDRSPGETESDVFLREALALAQAGDFRTAIGRLVLGGMSFVERQQWIRYRRGLTVHDYLRVLRSRPEQFAGFREVVHVFEPVEYGRRPATESLFATALAGYRQGFPSGFTNAERPVSSTTGN